MYTGNFNTNSDQKLRKFNEDVFLLLHHYCLIQQEQKDYKSKTEMIHYSKWGCN